jgi:hypothetical protein
MNEIKNIVDLFEKIAERHPYIQHNVGSNKSRFYRFNFDESDAGDKSSMEYPRLGLAMNTHDELDTIKTNIGTAYESTIQVKVIVIDSLKEKTDWDMETEIYNHTYNTISDIYDWLYKQAHAVNKCDYEIVERIKFENTPIRRVGPLGQTDAFGWSMTIKFVIPANMRVARNSIFDNNMKI